MGNQTSNINKDYIEKVNHILRSSDIEDRNKIIELITNAQKESTDVSLNNKEVIFDEENVENNPSISTDINDKNQTNSKTLEQIEPILSNIDYDKFESLKYNLNDKVKFSDFEKLEKKEKIKNFVKYAVGIGVGFTLFNSIGAVAAGIAIYKFSNKKQKKFKLTKDSYVKTITSIETKESSLIDDYNRKLEKKIEELIGDSNKYNLNVYKAKYENQIELLSQMINVRKNTRVKKGELTNRHLKVFALKQQLSTAKYNLNNINKRIKRKELISEIGKENINLDNPIYNNLTFGNIYLGTLNTGRKFKLYTEKVTNVVKNFISKRIIKKDDNNGIDDEYVTTIDWGHHKR